MKTLSDYKDEEAIELWARLLDPFVNIFKDKDVMGMFRSKKPSILIAQELLKSHKKEASDILLAIDPTPLNGLNILVRLVAMINEMTEDETLRSFFGLSAGANKHETSSGPATENIKDNLNTSSNM